MILSLYLFPSVYAQQGWQWGKQVEINTYDMAVDNHGNSYILWNVDRDYDVDGHTIHPFKAIWYGGPSIAVTSFTCDGTYRWTKVIGAKQTSCAGVAIGTDTLGGVYAWCGINSDNTDTVFVDQDTIVLPTRRRSLLVKFNSSGDFQWYRQLSPQEPASSQLSGGPAGLASMSVSVQGNVYLPCNLPPGTYGDGSFQATYPYVYDSVSGRCKYILEYDRNGNFKKGVHLDMFSQGGSVWDIQREPTTGNFYLAGHRGEAVVPVEITFGSNTPVTKTQFLGCFDSTGAFKWMQQNSDTDLYSPQGGTTAFDKAGNIYFDLGV